MNYFVTAIGTDSGKTLASAILCEALRADYWKPVQSGLPRDTATVEGLVSDARIVFHPEQFLLKTPVSPHTSAKLEGKSISLRDFVLPATRNDLIIEGAGGCLVPLNDDDLMADLITKLKCEAIVISNHYLGSINHTLLTIEALQRRNLIIRGIIFNNGPNEESERIILHRSKLKCLLRINREPVIDKQKVRQYAAILKAQWNG
jgi:dethiobiotin synthetase